MQDECLLDVHPVLRLPGDDGSRVCDEVVRDLVPRMDGHVVHDPGRGRPHGVEVELVGVSCAMRLAFSSAEAGASKFSMSIQVSV